MTSQWTSWRLQSPETRLFVQAVVQASIRENTGPLWGESIDNRWIHSQRASKPDGVTSWRHHGYSLEKSATICHNTMFETVAVTSAKLIGVLVYQFRLCLPGRLLCNNSLMQYIYTEQSMNYAHDSRFVFNCFESFNATCTPLIA